MSRSDISNRRSSLSATKRALLEKRILSRLNGLSEEEVIPRRGQQSPAPMSFAQQRLWRLCQVDGGPSYNTPRAVRIIGPLHIPAFEKSLNEIIRRHEALHTAFDVVDGQPVQIIVPPWALKLASIDLSRLRESRQEIQVRQIITELVQIPFDLASGQLMRAAILRLTEDNCVAVMAIHHMVSDAWSMSILTQELGTLYDAFSNGRRSPFPELAIQYADYASWQGGWLQGDVFEAQLVYWKDQLAGAAGILELPADRPRPANQTFHGAKQAITLSKGITGALRELGQSEGATLFMTLLAAYKTLLHRYSGQSDIIVGTPVANRTRAELEGLIGFFVNALALRTDLSGNPTFRELLARVREVAVGAYSHQDMPIEKLVEEVAPQRDPSRSPLFQAVFALQNAPASTLELAGLYLEPLEFSINTSKFDVTLSMKETRDGLAGAFEYNTDLFDGQTIHAMRRHFETLLEGIVANPDRPISDLPGEGGCLVRTSKTELE